VAPGFAWAHSRGFLRASPAQAWAALGASAPCALGSLPGEGGAGRWARGPLEGPAEAGPAEAADGSSRIFACLVADLLLQPDPLRAALPGARSE